MTFSVSLRHRVASARTRILARRTGGGQRARMRVFPVFSARCGLAAAGRWALCLSGVLLFSAGIAGCSSLILPARAAVVHHEIKHVKKPMPAVFSEAACLAMLSEDPDGARDYAASADAMHTRSAAHCDALAQIELGDTLTGAQRLDTLARQPPPARRAEGEDTVAGRATMAREAAEAWLMIRDPAKALDAATLSLSLRPGDLSARLVRDRALLSLGQDAEALADLQKMGPDKTMPAEALVLRAGAERSLNRLADARRDIDLALARNPEDADALVERGVIRMRSGDIAGARGDWEQVVSRMSDEPAADYARQDLALLDADPDTSPSP
ncbi:hypothetical protein LOC54_03185 [Acetobacter sp. AN02]|uniref:hypothetical protein n=1 Tax=Acetobacter sp. AN02 TaxID=2894186 RepID=UPI0024344272|nr:hypothetical protein [Acetobacter sp. AN02]MDG6094127.1 hypothetical protein [Acetobacter sp. AN02]